MIVGCLVLLIGNHLPHRLPGASGVVLELAAVACVVTGLVQVARAASRPRT